MADAEPPEDAHGGDCEPDRERVRRHHRMQRRRGRGDGGAGVREPRRPAPDSGSDAVELDPEDPDE